MLLYPHISTSLGAVGITCTHVALRLLLQTDADEPNARLG